MYILTTCLHIPRRFSQMWSKTRYESEKNKAWSFYIFDYLLELHGTLWFLKKNQSFSYFDNFKKRNWWLNIHLKFFDVKILWKTLISSSFVVWLMILIFKKYYTQVLFNLGALKWFFLGANFHYLVTKNYKENTLSQIPNVFKEFLAIFWGKKFLRLRHGF